MKNKIKLINLVPITALAILPIAATSCARTNWVEPLEMVDVKDGYEPQYEPPEIDDWQNQHDVTKFYIETVKRDPTIFQEDMINSISHRKNVLEQIATSMTMRGFKVGVSKPVFGTTRIWQTQAKDQLYNTISFRERIELTFDTSVDGEGPHVRNITQNITLNVEYKDVICMAYEPTFETQQENIVWSLGFLDLTYGAESLWVHMNNTQPWSINFSIVDQKQKFMRDVGGQPDIVITNTNYYSGNVNSAYRMLELYEYIVNHEDDVTGDEGLMEEMLKSVAQMNNESLYLSGIPNKADVCVYTQLGSKVTPEQKEGIDVAGVKLINPKNPNWQVTRVVIDNEGEDIKAVENAPSPESTAILTIKDQTQLKGHVIKDTPLFEKLTIPCTRSQTPALLETGLHSFNMPSMEIGVKIFYKKGTDPEEHYLSTKLNIHYGTLLLECNGN